MNARLLGLGCLITVALSVAVPVVGQLSAANGLNQSAAVSGQSGQPVVLSGVVLNANTNQPIARALVQLGSHSLLTEHDGKFEFTRDAGTSANLRVSKPGYFDSLDPDPHLKSVSFEPSAETLKLYLYPEGLLTGTIISPGGDPLSGISVQAMRKSNTEGDSGWTMAGQSISNSDGQFRLPLIAGDYVVLTRYVADQALLRKAVLPSAAPEPGNAGQPGAQSVIHLQSGTEQHLDLRPEIGSAHEVHVRVDGASNDPSTRIEAHLANGLSFFPISRQGPGEVIVNLPVGSYIVSVTGTDRDNSSYGEASITVGDKGLTGVVLHMTRALTLPVEIAVDPSSSTSDNGPPTAQQLGLRFIREDAGPGATNHEVYLRAGRGESAGFSLLPGRYRLMAQPFGQWFIESASVAGTDLRAEPFDVEPGGTAAPLHIVVSNRTSELEGTVKLAGNPAGSCWIYLVATTPALPAVYSVSSGPDGRFNRGSIQPGSYRAVAFESHHLVDFNDPATLEGLSGSIKSFTVAAGETANLEIDAIPTSELKR